MPSTHEEIAKRMALAHQGRARKREIWPIEVRDIVKAVHVHHRYLTGAYNFPVEIRSRAGRYYAMGEGQVGQGRSRDQAIAALIRLVDSVDDPAEVENAKIANV